MKDENLENTLITLHGRGWSIRKIARELGVSRKRIRRVLLSNTASRDDSSGPTASVRKPRASKLDPWKGYIGELLDKYKNITGQRVYELLKEKGFDGEISIVRDYLRTIRTLAKEPVRMVETAPGQRSAHDWSDYNIPFTRFNSGEATQVTFFSYILCYSRRQYINVVDDKTRETLFRELIAAFIYLDGVPREIKSDNQKACVDRWEAGGPVFNAKYLDFASHYRFRPLAITPGRPSENLKVERPFYYLERSFLRGREFSDMEDLKVQLKEWLTQVNDVRLHGTTRKRPVDMYTEEHPYLQPLPANHFDTSRLVHLVVNQESCVQWKGYLYAVASQYMYETCMVRITEDELVVYSSRGEQLVTHRLAEQGQKERYVGVLPKSKGKTQLVIAEVISRLEAFSPEMSQYIDQVKRHKPGSWRHHLRNLLALKVNYREEDILVAVRRAHRYKIFDTGHIENYLSNHAQSRYSVKLNPFKSDNNHDNRQ